MSLDEPLRQASIYGEFARVYDRAGFSDFSREMLPYTLHLLKHLGWEPPRRTALDLACGTGTAAVELARRGWEVTGLDASAAMLDVARAKAEAQGVRVEWTQGDMRAFRLPSRYGLVTCFFDALNYLLDPRELQTTFERVHEALVPGGVFVFDMNTDRGLQRWEEGEMAQIFPGLVSFMREVYDPTRRIAQVRLSFYLADEPGYRRIEEVHLERGYALEEIRHALAAAEFTAAHLFDCLTLERAGAATRRVAVAARRP